MKIQEITRNGSKYYHVYLPKNIVEKVLCWKGKDTLSYRVLKNSLVLKRDSDPLNEWEEELACKACDNPTVIIKIIKNPLRNQYLVVSRCPFDHSILKTSLPVAQLPQWKPLIVSQIFHCDLCNGLLLEEKRKYIRSNLGFRVRLKLFCKDCHHHRIKVIAHELWDNINQSIPIPSPSKIQTFLENSFPQPQSFTHCPTCEEPISPNQAFCSQCGTPLLEDISRKLDVRGKLKSL
ncbi:MAG: zinc-ribbon domain-containing protein [Candidatus Helarchaeota archaeon]